MKFSLLESAKSLLRLSECVIGKWARRGEVSWGVVKETTPPRPRGLRPIPSCHQKSRKRIWGRVVLCAPTIPPICGNMNGTKFWLFVKCRLAGLRKVLNVLFDFDLNNPQTMIQSWSSSLGAKIIKECFSAWLPAAQWTRFSFSVPLFPPRSLHFCPADLPVEELEGFMAMTAVTILTTMTIGTMTLRK